MSSPATFALLSSWIRECATEHEECFRLPEDLIEQLPEASTEPVRYTKKHTVMQAKPFLPSRVIDVGPRDGS